MTDNDALQVLSDFLGILEEHTEIIHSAIRHQRANLDNLLLTGESRQHHPQATGVNFPNDHLPNARRREN